MSGHSKWANIKRRKEVVDKRRGTAFTKLARVITVAAREGLPDPEMNFKLKMAVEKAKAANMPKDNIARAIERAKGGEGQALTQVTYEIVAPGGVGLVVTATTDNRNRTVAELKHTLKEFGASLAGPNAVAWQFASRGYVSVKPAPSERAREELELKAIDAGAVEIEQDEDALIFFTEPDKTSQVAEALVQETAVINDTGLSLIPIVSVTLTDTHAEETVQRLVDALEKLDEVDEVITNAT